MKKFAEIEFFLPNLSKQLSETSLLNQLNYILPREFNIISGTQLRSNKVLSRKSHQPPNIYFYCTLVSNKTPVPINRESLKTRAFREVCPPNTLQEEATGETAAQTRFPLALTAARSAIHVNPEVPPPLATTSSTSAPSASPYPIHRPTRHRGNREPNFPSEGE